MIVIRKDRLTVDHNRLTGMHLASGNGREAVDRDHTEFHQFVRFPSGTETAGTDIFIYTYRGLISFVLVRNHIFSPAKALNTRPYRLHA